MAISPQRLTIYLYSAHRAVIFAIAQLSCFNMLFLQSCSVFIYPTVAGRKYCSNRPYCSTSITIPASHSHCMLGLIHEDGDGALACCHWSVTNETNLVRASDNCIRYSVRRHRQRKWGETLTGMRVSVTLRVTRRRKCQSSLLVDRSVAISVTITWRRDRITL